MASDDQYLNPFDEHTAMWADEFGHKERNDFVSDLTWPEPKRDLPWVGIGVLAIFVVGAVLIALVNGVR